jgi:hypothetical protein
VEIGFTGFLTLIFIVLKITGFIAWSWWWVLSPLWISALASLFLFAMFFLFATAFGTSQTRVRFYRKK